MFIDSDWAEDETDSKSLYGYVAMLANGPINWGFKKQTSVTLLIMEAEYTRLSETAKEIIYLKSLLLHMNLSKLVSNEVSVYCDNKSAVQLSKNNVFHRYYNIRVLQENGEINARFVNSIEMIVNILTKSLSKVNLYRWIELISLEK